jgi:hypothetical protein
LKELDFEQPTLSHRGLLAKVTADQVIGIALASKSAQRAVATPIRNTSLVNILQHGRDLGANCSAVDSIFDELVTDDQLKENSFLAPCVAAGRSGTGDFINSAARHFHHQHNHHHHYNHRRHHHI